MRPATTTDAELASPEEAAQAMAALTPPEMARLHQVARIRASGMAWLDWRDLLQEAIERILNGARRWPRDVPFVPFVREVMRSIASDHWRRHTTGPVRSEAEMGGDEAVGVLLADRASEEPSPEREVAARRALERIKELFESDPAALAVLKGLAEGASPAEIQREANMSPTDYASTQRRIRRSLARAFPTQESWS